MKKFYKGVCKLERVLCTICLCSCTISLFVGAVMRTLDLPLNYTTDIALFSFAWCIFLGVGAAYREDKLVYVNVMIDRVPQKWRRAINAVTYLVIAVFLAVMVLYGHPALQSELGAFLAVHPFLELQLDHNERSGRLPFAVCHDAYQILRSDSKRKRCEQRLYQ